MMARPSSDEVDVRAMQRLVQRSWPVEKPLVRHHIGDIAWAGFQHTGGGAKWRVRFWEDAGEPVAWAWVTLPERLDFHIHPDRRTPEMLAEIIEWCAAEAQHAGETNGLYTTALESD